MSSKRLPIHLGLTLLSFVIPAVWSGVQHLPHHSDTPPPAVVTVPAKVPVACSPSGEGTRTTEVNPSPTAVGGLTACDAAQLVQELHDLQTSH
ncbi:hypothetical protein [Deinococcus hopiensis]|uniref:hypothetical protein n=1 Tax=Deinococcus hopiensis TaxID=309885 RepID=UPI00111C628F|nr:hypothetical protein [Deinococcus hopiensis]